MFAAIAGAFRRFFSIDVDRLPDGKIDRLPDRLGAFIWFFVRQIKGQMIVFGLFELCSAAALAFSYWYVGELVERQSYTSAFFVLGGAIIASRWLFNVCLFAYKDLVYAPDFPNMVRRQLYWYTVRQSLTYFNDDFAGRISNKILQTGQSFRDVIASVVSAAWFVFVFVVTNIFVLGARDIMLAVPILIWALLYSGALAFFLPRIMRKSKVYGEVASVMSGQMVDGFTNILPIKYFARAPQEDSRTVGLLHEHSAKFKAMARDMLGMQVVNEFLNAFLLVSMACIGLYLVEAQGQVGIAALAMGLPLASQVVSKSYWIMFESMNIFDGLGRIQEGMEALAKPHTLVDRDGAKPLQVEGGKADIVFDDVEFHYGSDAKTLMQGFSLSIPAGQKVGLVGKSGAGKSTIINLLARAHDVEGGAITINGQNIADVTQDTLREAMAVVTQDSHLFHRSIMENILYGKMDASDAQVEQAAKRAFAYDFIIDQEDNKGRTGFDAHVGERGVKLSGGQKQRINIARTLLKDAPILVLDEATSALDSESEGQIQAALEAVMEGKTVIAIAHRLSTLKQMDRIIVMDKGVIIEDGTHADLIERKDGHYAKLWGMQSGGFV